MILNNAVPREHLRLIFGVLSRAKQPLMCLEIRQKDRRIPIGSLHKALATLSGHGDDTYLKLAGYKNVNGRSQGIYTLSERGRRELKAMNADEASSRRTSRTSQGERS